MFLTKKKLKGAKKTRAREMRSCIIRALIITSYSYHIITEIASHDSSKFKKRLSKILKAIKEEVQRVGLLITSTACR